MWEEVIGQPENLENGQLLSECGFIQRIAPSSLSRERRIKIYQSIKPTVSTGSAKSHAPQPKLYRSAINFFWIKEEKIVVNFFLMILFHDM